MTKLVLSVWDEQLLADLQASGVDHALVARVKAALVTEQQVGQDSDVLLQFVTWLGDEFKPGAKVSTDEIWGKLKQLGAQL